MEIKKYNQILLAIIGTGIIGAIIVLIIVSMILLIVFLIPSNKDSGIKIDKKIEKTEGYFDFRTWRSGRRQLRSVISSWI